MIRPGSDEACHHRVHAIEWSVKNTFCGLINWLVGQLVDTEKSMSWTFCLERKAVLAPPRGNDPAVGWQWRNPCKTNEKHLPLVRFDFCLLTC
jgi:hypothetical protein